VARKKIKQKTGASGEGKKKGIWFFWEKKACLA